MLTIALPKTGVYLVKNESVVQICERGTSPHGVLMRGKSIGSMTSRLLL